MLPTQQEVRQIPIRELTNTVDQIVERMRDPNIKKQFVGNVHLLMGQNQINIGKLARLAGCDPSTVYSLLNGRGKFERKNLLIFANIAKTLGVNMYTLLFVDLSTKLSELIYMTESQKGYQRILF